jgi:photosystem II stability/assembly factor-like uncharacterized protein
MADNMRAVYFIDSKHGWAGGVEGRLYKTDDGGGSWQNVSIEAPREADVQNIFFLNDLVGWIVLQKSASSVLEYDRNYFRLMQTVDGGRNWRLQYEDKGVGISHLIFADQQNGWLTGIEYKRPVLNDYLILHTSDQGQHWEDASVELKRMVANHPDELNEGIMGVAFTQPTTTTVITSGLRMFQTANDGKSWRRVGSIQNKLGLTNVTRRLGLMQDKHLWSIGGTSGPNGTRGLLFIQKDEDSWTKNILNDVFFTDAVSPSKNQFLASGFVMNTEKVKGTYRGRQAGIVLSSIDNGKTWEVVYMNPGIQSVNAITFTDGFAWAVADKGLLIRLVPIR